MALEEPDAGLGSCQAVTPRLADSSTWPHDSQEQEAEDSPAGRVDNRPKKTEKEYVAKVAPGPSKEKLKAGATPRSPARKKAQAAPPLQPPPPPPALSEELPWGDMSLNKCLVLASLVALLGSAFQLCRDVMVGEADTPAPAREPWVPSSSAPKKPASPPLKPVAWAPTPGSSVQTEVRPSAPQVQTENAAVSRSEEAAEMEEGEPEEAAGEESSPLDHGAPRKRLQKEKPRKEERSRKERSRKERSRKEERPRKPEKPQASRKPQEALPRRLKERKASYRPWARDSRDHEHRKRQSWAFRRPNAEDWPPGRQKHRTSRGRD